MAHKKEYNRNQILYVEEIKKKHRNIKNYIKARKKGYWDGKTRYCYNITEKWLGKKPEQIKSVIKHKIYDSFKYKGKEYYIDGKNIVIQFDNGEENFADLIATKTRKRIEMFPRFNKPERIRTADSKIGKEYVDLKITTSDSDHFIIDNIYQSKGQANHFAFDINNENISKDEILYQVDNSFRKFKFVKTIIINSKFGFCVYKRAKKKYSPEQKMVAPTSTS